MKIDFLLAIVHSVFWLVAMYFEYTANFLFAPGKGGVLIYLFVMSSAHPIGLLLVIGATVLAMYLTYKVLSIFAPSSPYPAIHTAILFGGIFGAALAAY